MRYPKEVSFFYDDTWFLKALGGVGVKVIIGEWVSRWHVNQIILVFLFWLVFVLNYCRAIFE